MKHLFSLLLVLTVITGCSEPDRPDVGLYVAIKRGDIDQIERHIYWHSDINKINPDGNTPLHESAIAGRIVITRLLLQNGADIDAKNRDGKSVLQLALENGRVPLAEVLVKKFNVKFDPNTLLFNMVSSATSDRDVFAFLSHHGADLNAFNNDGETPLSLAVLSANRLQAKHLINNNADVNQANRHGLLPLDIARQKNSIELIRLLENNGALSGQTTTDN